MRCKWTDVNGKRSCYKDSCRVAPGEHQRRYCHLPGHAPPGSSSTYLAPIKPPIAKTKKVAATKAEKKVVPQKKVAPPVRSVLRTGQLQAGVSRLQACIATYTVTATKVGYISLASATIYRLPDVVT